MSLTCPNCGTDVALALAVATPNPARPRGSELSTGASEVAPPVAHIGSLEVALELGPKAKAKAQRKKITYSAEFLEFWEFFPIHRDKAKAQIAFDAALDAGYEVDDIINGAAAYARWLKTTTTAPKYAQGWITGRRWEDELDTPAPAGETNPAYTVGTPEYEARMIAEGVW